MLFSLIILLQINFTSNHYTIQSDENNNVDQLIKKIFDI